MVPVDPQFELHRSKHSLMVCSLEILHTFQLVFAEHGPRVSWLKLLRIQTLTFDSLDVRPKLALHWRNRYHGRGEFEHEQHYEFAYQ